MLSTNYFIVQDISLHFHVKFVFQTSAWLSKCEVFNLFKRNFIYSNITYLHRTCQQLMDFFLIWRSIKIFNSKKERTIYSKQIFTFANFFHRLFFNSLKNSVLNQLVPTKEKRNVRFKFIGKVCLKSCTSFYI